MMCEHINRNEAIVQGHSSSIRIMEARLRQLATDMNSCQPDTLPINTESPIIKGKEHCKAITLRSDKQTVDSTQQSPIYIQERAQLLKTGSMLKDGMEDGIDDDTHTDITPLPPVLQSKLSVQSTNPPSPRLL
ncbi:hypothetical protein V6N13_042972 [Hibiscus sabdariffa]|uniref:Uncharacterized protein n=1 Tax=Hibiscus sabdariffa TaxID=183260 RepID=A0ABR2G390_9ROSI